MRRLRDFSLCLYLLLLWPLVVNADTMQGTGQLLLAAQGIEVVFAQQARMHFQHLLLHAARRIKLATPQQRLGQLALAHQGFRMVEPVRALARTRVVEALTPIRASIYSRIWTS